MLRPVWVGALAGVTVLLLVANSSLIGDIKMSSYIDNSRCAVGIPVTDRDAEYAHQVVKSAAEAAVMSGLTLDFFLAHRATDQLVQPTYAAAILAHGLGAKLEIVIVQDYTEFKGDGPINTAIQRHLSIVRNTLLDTVQSQGYRCFLSLDADVLLHRTTLQQMLTTDHGVVTALYPSRWLRPDADSVIMMLRDQSDMARLTLAVQQTLGTSSAAAPEPEKAVDFPCNYLDGVINFHLQNLSQPQVATAFVAGGCTLVRGAAMDVRTSHMTMTCAVSLGSRQHCFWYHGEDVGWGFNFMRHGYHPHVLTQHVVTHLAAHKAPTNLVPLPDQWPVNLTGRSISLPLQLCT